MLLHVPPFAIGRSFCCGADRKGVSFGRSKRSFAAEKRWFGGNKLSFGSTKLLSDAALRVHKALSCYAALS